MWWRDGGGVVTNEEVVAAAWTGGGGCGGEWWRDVSIGIMEIEPDIENMTLNGYLDYEAEKERRLWDNVRSRRSPTNYDEADVDSFHQNKIYFDQPRPPEKVFFILDKDVIQPLIPKTLHTTPPKEDYVAPASKSILDKILEDNILNVVMVDEEADPTRDLEKLERILVESPYFTEIQVPVAK
ncbi:hypothetical protein Tco_1056754 [Tanacetum coccineum]|uniref:Uncharacterized protein n=1 Tax=Tanacetum coccineum TaxID=301880 RepID=A0ABQ5H3F9_9ASTR